MKFEKTFSQQNRRVLGEDKVGVVLENTRFALAVTSGQNLIESGLKTAVSHWFVHLYEPGETLETDEAEVGEVPQLANASPGSGLTFSAANGRNYAAELWQDFAPTAGQTMSLALFYSVKPGTKAKRSVLGARPRIAILVLDEDGTIAENQSSITTGDTAVHGVTCQWIATGKVTRVGVYVQGSAGTHVTLKEVQLTSRTTAGGTGSRLTIHYMPSGKTTRIMEWLRAAPKAITFYGNWGLAEHCSPLTTYRVGVRANRTDAQQQYNSGKTPGQAAAEFCDWHMDGYRLDTGITHWAGHNEPGVTSADFMVWYTQFEIERMEIMSSFGLKCAIGKFPTGGPELEYWPYFMPAIAAAHRHGAILLLHEYGGNVMWWGTGKHQLANLRQAASITTEPYVDRHILKEPAVLGTTQRPEGWLTLRYRQAYRIFRELRPDLPDLPLVIAECGLDRVGSTPVGWEVSSYKKLGASWQRLFNEPDKDKFYFRQLQWYDAQLRQDAFVQGACLFTYGTRDNTWDGFDFAQEPLEQLLLAHLAATPLTPPEPTPPTPPEPNYRAVAHLLPPTMTDGEWAGLVKMVRATGATCTMSADDAGRLVAAGNEKSTVIVYHPERWQSGDVVAWLRKRYAVRVETAVFEAASPKPPDLPDGRLVVLPISQRNPAWANLRLGTGDHGKTIGNWGCLLTVYTMMSNFLGITDQWTPAQANEHFIRTGALSQQYTVSGALKVAFPKAVNYDGFKERSDPTMTATIEKYLKMGIPVPARVDFKPSTQAWEQHWVLLVRSSGGVFWAADPWHGDIVNLADRYGIPGIDVTSAIFYTPAPARPSTKLQIGTHGMGGASWMISAGLKGLAIDTVALGSSATTLDYRAFQDKGIDVYVRLNYGYGNTGTVPEYDTPEWNRFAGACVETVKRSQGAKGFYVGNEPNNSAEWPDGVPITPEHLAELTNKLHKEKPAGVLVGTTPLDPYFGPYHLYNAYPAQKSLANAATWWNAYLAALREVDFVVLHAKTQDSDPENVHSNTLFSDPPLTWQFLHFRTYRKMLDLIPLRLHHLPAIIAEANPQRQQPNGKLGWDCEQGGKWVDEAIADIREYNSLSLGNRVAGVAFYRWADDDWAIDKCSPVLDAIKRHAA